MPRLQITPDDFKRAKLVKPGWYVTLIKTVTEELNSKKDATNIVLECENADKDSEYLGVPVKHWCSEKGVSMPGGAVSVIKAFNPKISEESMADVEFSEFQGRYIYAKWGTNRGKDGTDPPRNVVEDWAPLPSKYSALADVKKDSISEGAAGFGG